MNLPRIAAVCLALVLCLPAIAGYDPGAGEVLVHEEPEFTSPGLSAGEEITFRKDGTVVKSRLRKVAKK
jgi:hypothetical protein